MSQDRPQPVVHPPFRPGIRVVLGVLGILCGLTTAALPQDAPNLIQAVKQGDVALIKDILANDPEQVNLRNKDGESALHWAALKGYRDIAVILLGKGAKVHYTDKQLGGTPLHWAAVKGHRDLVELLLDRGADVNATTRDEWTPLHIAAYQGHREVVEVLLERKANIHARDKDGLTPLQASIENRRNLLELMLDKGGREAPKVSTASGNKPAALDAAVPPATTAEDTAALANRAAKLEHSLREKGADLKVKEAALTDLQKRLSAAETLVADLTDKAKSVDAVKDRLERETKMAAEFQAKVADEEKRRQAAERKIAELQTAHREDTLALKGKLATRDMEIAELKAAQARRPEKAKPDESREAADKARDEAEREWAETLKVKEGEIEDLKRQIQLLDKRNQELASRSDAPEATPTDPEITGAKARIAELENQLQVARDLGEKAWADERTALKRRIDELTAAAEAADRRKTPTPSGTGVEDLKRKMEGEWEARLKAREDEVAVLKQQTQASEKRHQALAAKIEEVEKIKQDLQDTRAVLRTEKEKTAQMDGDLKAVRQRLDEERKAAGDAVATMKVKLAEVEERNKALAAANEPLGKELEQARKLREQLDAVQDDLTEKEQELQEAKARIADLEKQIPVARESSEKAWTGEVVAVKPAASTDEKLGQALSAKAEEVEKLKQELQDARAALRKSIRQHLDEQRKATGDVVATLKIKLAEVEERNKALAGATEPLRKELEQTRPAQERLTAVQNDLAEKDKALQEAKARIAEMEKQAKLARDLNEKTGENEAAALQTAAAKRGRELAAKSEEAGKFKQELQDARAALQTEKGKTAQTDGELKAVRQRLDEDRKAAVDAVATLKIKLAEVEERNKALAGATEPLRKELEQTRPAQERLTAVQNDLAEKDKALQEAKTRVVELEKQARLSGDLNEKAWADEKAALKRRIDELTAAAEEADRRRKSLPSKKETEQLKQALQDARAALQTEKEKAAQMDGDLKAARRRLDEDRKAAVDTIAALKLKAAEKDAATGKEIGDLKAAREQLQRGLAASLKTEKETSEKIREAMAGRVKELELATAELEKAKKATEQIQARALALDAQLKALESKLAAADILKAEKESLQKEVQDRSTALDRMQEKLVQARNAAQELEDRRKNADELRHENDRLKGLVAASQAEAKSASAQLETLRNQANSETAGLKEKVQALEAQVETAKISMFDQAKIIDLLRAKLKARSGSPADSAEASPKTRKGKAQGDAPAIPPGAVVPAARAAPEAGAAASVAQAPQKEAATGALSAFFDAVASGDIAAVRKTVAEHPARIKAARENGETPLHVAAENGRKDIVALLLGAGADAQARDAITGFTPLHEAAYNNHQAVLELLLQQGADVNATSDIGTSLHLAVSLGNMDLVRFLLKRGADINAKSDLGTPLHIAIFNGDRKMADLLRKHGGKE
ncbi:MAG: ankyrin repeat domain-containing protein [Lentisphaerae bacterium]|nr:ankyrin repeat domain-containing protein [Lentisphaerota bacterium]